MKDIVITNIDYVEVSDRYLQLMRPLTLFPKFCSAEPDTPISMIDEETLRTETVETRQFYVNRMTGSNPDGSPKYERELDIRLGVASDVQKALGIYIEGASDAFNEAEKKSGELEDVRRKLYSATNHIIELSGLYSDTCTKLEESMIETEEYTSMTFWQRLKWAFKA